MHTRIIDCRGYERGGRTLGHRRSPEGHQTLHLEEARRSGPSAANRRMTCGFASRSIRTWQIHEAVAVTRCRPFEPCGDITPKFAALVGRRIGRGWTKGVARDTRRRPRCTHQWNCWGALPPWGLPVRQSVSPLRAAQARTDTLPLNYRVYIYAPTKRRDIAALARSLHRSKTKTEEAGQHS